MRERLLHHFCIFGASYGDGGIGRHSQTLLKSRAFSVAFTERR